MKRVCKQCGKEFEMTQHEIQFYKKKKLSLPKRCKECREKNKLEKQGGIKIDKAVGTESPINGKNKQTVRKENSRNTGTASLDKMVNTYNHEERQPMKGKKKTLAGLIAALLVVGFGIFHGINEPSSTSDEQQTNTNHLVSEDLEFRSEELLEEHYEKHGVEMGFDSAEEYEDAAAEVVSNSAVLHKTEAEDGDDVYYLEDTNEFVIVSTDGYIRTYFEPEDGLEYFERQ